MTAEWVRKLVQGKKARVAATPEAVVLPDTPVPMGPDDVPAGRVEAFGRLAQLTFPDNPERDGEDRRLLNQIKAGDPAATVSINKLMTKYQATFARKLDHLQVPKSDQTGVIDDVFFALYKRPRDWPEGIPPLARLRNMLLWATLAYFKAEKRAQKPDRDAGGLFSPDAWVHRPKTSQRDSTTAHGTELDELHPLQERISDPTFEQAASRELIERLRDALDAAVVADPDHIQLAELLKAVWDSDMDIAEIAAYRWEQCLKTCEVKCAQDRCLKRQGTMEGAKQQLHRARKWIQSTLDNLR